MRLVSTVLHNMTTTSACVRCGEAFSQHNGALECSVHTDTFCPETKKWRCCGKRAHLGHERSVTGCLTIEHTTDHRCHYFSANARLLFRKQMLSDLLLAHVNKHGAITMRHLHMEYGILNPSRCCLIQSPQDEAAVHRWQLRTRIQPLLLSAKDALGDVACCVRQTRRPVMDKFMPPTSMVAGQSKRRRLSAPYLLVCKCDVETQSQPLPNDTE